MGSSPSSISRGKTESPLVAPVLPLVGSAKASPIPETDVSCEDSTGQHRRMAGYEANSRNAPAHTQDVLDQVSESFSIAQTVPPPAGDTFCTKVHSQDFGYANTGYLKNRTIAPVARDGSASAPKLAVLPLMEHIWFTVAMNGFETEGNESSFYTCKESLSCSNLDTLHTSPEDVSSRRGLLLHSSHPLAPPPVPPTLLSLCNVMPKSKLSEVLLPAHQRSPVLPPPAEQVPLMQCSLVPLRASTSASASSLRSLSSTASLRSLYSAGAASPGVRCSDDAQCDEVNVQTMTRLEMATSRTGMRLQQAVREHERRERLNDSLPRSPSALGAALGGAEEVLSAGTCGLGLVMRSPTSTTLSSFTVWDADAVEESEVGFEMHALDAGAGAGTEQPLFGLGLSDFVQAAFESSGSISRLVGQSDIADYSTPGAPTFGYVEHAGIEPSGVLPDIPCLAPRTFEPGVENWLLSITEVEPLPPLDDELEESTSPVAKLTDVVPPKSIKPPGVLPVSLSHGTETKEISESLLVRRGAGASTVAGAALFRGVCLGGVDVDVVAHRVPRCVAPFVPKPTPLRQSHVPVQDVGG